MGGGVLNVGPASLIVDMESAVVGQTIRVTRIPDEDLSGTGGRASESGAPFDEAFLGPFERAHLSLAEVEVLTLDQRNYIAADGNVGGSADGRVSAVRRPDIGAYEFDLASLDLSAFPQSPFLVTTTDDELDYTNDRVSLREAIALANVYPGADTISFDASLAVNNCLTM